MKITIITRNSSHCCSAS